MRRALFAVFVCALAARAQGPTVQAAADAEQAELNRVMGEVGASSIDIIHVLEQHLAKYPNSPRRDAIEQTLYKSAAEI
ncbi:MAG TPA: hypothetical protein VEF06_06525, partial [Bryobacteraceae bacterium]|nr:hypothetical protein [Bryobacteraceae bacterium]